MSLRKMLSSKIAIGALVLLVIFLANLKFRQYKNQQAILGQIFSLQHQADDMQKQSDQLQKLLQTISSPDAKEKIAREELNYKKQGEVVYGFSESPQQVATAAQSSNGSSNAIKWWNYFFKD